MNVSKFFQYQEQFNNQLPLDKSLNSYKITTRKHLELQVQIGELANLTKCFKYWVKKDDSVCINSILTKYIDCLGNIVTIGLDRNFSNLTNILVKPNDYCLSDQFLNLYIDINDLITSPSFDHYETLFEDFLSLGISLGFSREIIINKFLQKATVKVAL